MEPLDHEPLDPNMGADASVEAYNKINKKKRLPSREAVIKLTHLAEKLGVGSFCILVSNRELYCDPLCATNNFAWAKEAMEMVLGPDNEKEA